MLALQGHRAAGMTLQWVTCTGILEVVLVNLN